MAGTASARWSVTPVPVLVLQVLLLLHESHSHGKDADMYAVPRTEFQESLGLTEQLHLRWGRGFLIYLSVEGVPCLTHHEAQLSSNFHLGLGLPPILLQ